MAQDVGTLAITLTANAAPLTAGLRAAQTQIANFGGTVNIFKAAGGAGAGAAGGPLAAAVAGALALKSGVSAAADAMGALKDMTVSAGRAAFDLGSHAVQLAADYQDARTSFEVFTGSAEKGTALLKRVQEFAATSPFESNDLIKQGRMLMGMGVSAENVLPSLRTLGEVASGMGGGAESVQRLSLAFGQVMAKGRLMGQEVLQFAEAGIGVGEFAKTAGQSVLMFQKNMEAGKVGADVMVNTFNRLTAPGGRFFGLMDKIGDNWNARVNNIKESVTLGLQDAGLGLIRGLQNSGALGFVQDQVEWFRTAAPGIGDAIGAAFARVKPLVDSAGASVKGFAAAFRAVGAEFAKTGAAGLSEDTMRRLATDGVGGLVTAFGYLTGAAIKFGGTLGDQVILPFLEFTARLTTNLAKMQDAFGRLALAQGNRVGAKEYFDTAKGLRATAAAAREAQWPVYLLSQQAQRPGLMGEFAANARKEFDDAMSKGPTTKSALQAFWPGMAVALDTAEKIKTTIGQIKPPSLLPPDVVQRAMDVAKDMDAANPIKKYQDAFSATVRAGYMRTVDDKGVRSNPLLNMGQVRFGLVDAFRDLEKSLGDATAKMPSAVVAGTVEAQKAINQAQTDADKNNPIRRVADTLARAERYQKEQVEETKRLADAILGTRVRGKGV